MRCLTIHRSVILLMIVFLWLTSSRANVQADQNNEQIELVGPSFGIACAQTVSISVVVYAGRPTRTNDPVITRIQLLDTEGEVIAQSDEISVAPDQIRSWDVPRELLPEGEPTGRLQVRARILATTRATARPPALAATVELFDSAKRSTPVIWIKLRIRQRFPEIASNDSKQR